MVRGASQRKKDRELSHDSRSALSTERNSSGDAINGAREAPRSPLDIPTWRRRCLGRPWG